MCATCKSIILRSGYYPLVIRLEREAFACISILDILMFFSAVTDKSRTRLACPAPIIIQIYI
ncbi:hypothetical protein QTP88_028549 [Uroleucon formosanum]